MNTPIKKHFWLIVVLLAFGCNNINQTMKLQSGDLIFCNYETSELSSAIDKVTQTKHQTHYSHMGIVELNGADTFIIHASLKRGVVKESIQSFLTYDNPNIVDVYRLKNDVQHSIPQAIKNIHKWIGLPYNSPYIMNDTCFYCSQLIYKAFEKDSIFKLEPMTFKNPETNTYNEGWINYYKNLNIEIPEGEPGCNPNGMAASEQLIYIGRYHYFLQ